MVIPLEECIARPDRPPRTFPLTQHLRNVGQHAAQWVTGPRRDYVRLAGLLHDIGKARRSWQAYIRNDGPRVPHAFLGAAVFFYLVSSHSLSADDQRFVMWLTRDVAHHHSHLGDLDPGEPPWLSQWQPAAVHEVDWPAVRQFLLEEVPWSAERLPTDPQKIIQAIQRLERTWRSWAMMWPRISEMSIVTQELVRTATASLIQADRFDAADIEIDLGITPDAAQRALKIIRQHLVEDTHPGTPMLQAYRHHAQEAVWNTFKSATTPIVLLQMPTGSGKTIAALVCAMDLIAESDAPRRLIYVAPYLSIVEQTAEVIRQTTEIPVLVHHHLSLPDRLPQSRANEEKPEGILLAMESWQAPVIVTTFNQLFRAGSTSIIVGSP
ncbi:MAG: CRISPR-associated endonuclease Cas3'' [Firmicutes bacterium]|nr:CRISPR-associated endonuclease Cas3'' [Bacillota bacterium]